MKILIWGAGSSGQRYKRYIEEFTQDEFVGFIDSATPSGMGHISPLNIEEQEFDLLVVSPELKKYRDEIKKQLNELPVDKSKVIFLVEDEELKLKVFSSINAYDENNDKRVLWLAEFAKYAKIFDLGGSVAECGVNIGEFAEFINKYFPDKKLYLFDTFDGFSEKDLAAERKFQAPGFLRGPFNSNEHFRIANINIVKNRMPYPHNLEFHVGYFPESAEGVNDEFCFVSLDTDLYNPILAGLEFFYPKMIEGGVVLVHDFLDDYLPGVSKAVHDYEKIHNIKFHKFPIGDNESLGIIK